MYAKWPLAGFTVSESSILKVAVQEGDTIVSEFNLPKLIKDVFSPETDEVVTILSDLPHRVAGTFGHKITSAMFSSHVDFPSWLLVGYPKHNRR